MLNPDRGIALFTDGSGHHIDRSGGWAWCAIDCFDNEEVGSGHESDTTNNRMEMQAWIEGLNHLVETLGPCDVLVYCDSQLVGYGVTGKYRRRKNLDLWFEMDAAIERHHYIEFVWVKGHHESHYNHLVDELAGNARKVGRDECKA